MSEYHRPKDDDPFAKQWKAAKEYAARRRAEEQSEAKRPEGYVDPSFFRVIDVQQPKPSAAQRVLSFRMRFQSFLTKHEVTIRTYIDELMDRAASTTRVSAQQSSELYTHAEKIDNLFQDMKKDPQKFFTENKLTAEDFSMCLKQGYDGATQYVSREYKAALIDAEIAFNALFKYIPPVSQIR